MDPSSKDSTNRDSAVIDTTAISAQINLKDKVGDAANNWLARNRSLVLRQTPVWAQTFAALLISLGSLSVIGAFFFRIDEVITVRGQLQSIGGTTEVKTTAGGRVDSVFFEDGDIVTKGQLLLRFDTRQALLDKNTLTSQIKLEKEQLQTQLKTLNSQQTTLQGRQQVLEQRLNTKNQIINNMKVLVVQGGFQRMQYLEQLDIAYELRSQLTDVQEQRSRIELESQRLKIQSKKSIDQMTSSLKKAELQLQYQNVAAPVSGIVFDPQASPESVLASGQRILSIVPQEGYYAQVNVPNQDIGFIKIGQKANVRVDAFPFSRYGDIPATVSQIAADALPPSNIQNFYRFPVKLSLNRYNLESQGVKIPLKAGMAITTNLKLRDKRVISLISDVFIDQTDSIKSLRQQ